MDLERAREIITTWARAEFGKLLQVRDVAVVRRATGRVWSGDVYCATREGDVRVGAVCVEETGGIVDLVDVDAVVDALVAVRLAATRRPSLPAAPAFEAETDFSDLALDGAAPAAGEGGEVAGDDLESVFDALESSSIQDVANRLIATGEREKLLEARSLLPQLLVAPDNRGHVLRQMGELELLLGELDLGVNYLEAAAREFADVADVSSLEEIARLTAQVIGPAALETSVVKLLLDRAKARMLPIDRIEQAPIFVGLSEEEVFNLRGAGVSISLVQGEDLLREGEPAVKAFVVRSGVLSVRLETPGGSARIVRSCFPGDFIGESSVLGPAGCTCTATIRSEVQTALWRFDGAQLRDIIAEYPDIGTRIESARTLHRLDSFLSMHDATAALDVAVRDQLLGSINGIARVKAGDRLNAAGRVPTAIYLVVEGRLEYHLPGGGVRAYGPDAFAGLKDSLHELPLEGDLLAATDGVVVRFDPNRLRSIAGAATPEVIAVLEKME
jgi:CRP-like cAMP-binding protein